jgi:hypothetical protein
LKFRVRRPARRAKLVERLHRRAARRARLAGGADRLGIDRRRVEELDFGSQFQISDFRFERAAEIIRRRCTMLADSIIQNAAP